jgi:hypothetical protein
VAQGRKERQQTVRLGRTAEDGVAPSIFGLIARGVERRPDVARAMRGKVVFRFQEPIAPVRIRFGPRVVVVEDGDVKKPNLAIEGTMPDIVHFATAPLFRGVPNPTVSRGRRALSRIASRRVRISGSQSLARKLLQLLTLET